MEHNRNSMVALMALIKKNVVAAIEQISEKSPLRVKVVDDKVSYSYSARIISKLDRLIEEIKELNDNIKSMKK